MSKRIFHPFQILAVIAASSLLLALVSCFPHTTPRSAESHGATFVFVHDTPIVNTMDEYYHLLDKGWATVTVDGSTYKIYLSDMSQEERRLLQLMLRTP